ncbi:ATP-binding cassette domain-containing protein [Actinomyces oris]|uniref:ABC transporter ATP-binding protein n=1 Tax=Actinomyces oris TaxID=544580 RepID=A0A1Q8WQC5_9ACTO|nr:ABC transporter ATP-binding protein [Actinomyces oris]OLO70336.1 glutathione ABC transporter ATP-binding protein [Actinomyces oris]QQC39557.1 ABC transporter ATP-binding protein [Actinomyces oris]TQD63381.1 ABC transporter ATP-binding protein [Actinomyces oris]
MSRQTQGARAQSTDVPVADDAALSLRGFGVTFAGSDTPASTGIDLDLRPGRVQALVGESGSGKSVTALGALGLLPPTATVTGSARVIDPDAARQAGRDGGESGTADAVELVGASRPVLDDVRGRLVGTIFQEPTTALDPLETIAFQIGEAVRAHPDAFRRAHASAGSDAGSQAGGGGRRRPGRPGLPGRSGRSGRLSRAEVDARVRELLARVGLGGRSTGGKDSADDADGADRADGEVLERIARSYPHQLSGGQLQRACIALAMACDPPVLIADEPTTALDVTVQAGILDLLRSLTRDEGVAVLLITHDMAVVADVADDVAVMRHGRIVERAAVREIFQRPRHEYTRELLAAVPRLDSLRQEDPFAAVARESEAPAKGAAEPVVAVEGLNVVYRNGRRTVHAVHDASLTIAPGEVLGLVGESGSGKSTIAGTLTGLVPIASGSVRVDGVEVAGARRRDLLPVRRSTGVVYQNPASSLNPRRTVGASIAEPMLIHGGFDSPARRARVRELLEAVRLPAAMAERYPHEMSGGQRQRVAIARALALDPRLVIADEPTSALDVSVQAVVLDLLRALQAELGFACLFVSHDLAVVDSIAARTVVLSAGRVVESGPTEQVLARPREDYTRRLVMAVPVPDPAVQAARRERRRALKAVEGVHA